MADELDQSTKEERAGCVHNAIAYHDVTDVPDSKGAPNVGLCIIAPDEALFHTAVESQHHQKFLVRGPPPVAERGDQGVEGELPVLIVIILVQFDLVQENNNDDDGDYGTSGVDSTHRVHLL